MSEQRIPISPEILGLQVSGIPVSWTERDTIIYALGIGADPIRELDYVYEAHGPLVFPTYGVVPTAPPFEKLLAQLAVDGRNVLHGEQAIACLRRLPPAANGLASAQIIGVWDKGAAALLEVETVLEDQDGELFRGRTGLFIRDAGGFGGPRGPSGVEEAVDPPERAPDCRFETFIHQEQAAVYRLSGDTNPLHIDPDYARQAGFDRPFIHGLCTYGIIGRAVLHELCGGHLDRFRELKGRFAGQVYPGDNLVVDIWVADQGSAVLQANTADGRSVFSRGVARFSSG